MRSKSKMSAVNKSVNNSKQNCSVSGTITTNGIGNCIGNGIGNSIGNSIGNGIGNGIGNPCAGNSNDILTPNHVSPHQSLSSAKPNASSVAPSSSTPECFGCHKVIRERYLLKALDHLWHEDCLKCACCDCRLGEVGSTLFTKADLILCKRDYLRMFGTTGLCSACNKQIPAFEMVMRARGNVYHLECFACQQCNHRFCVGDRFYLYENKILCEYDYEERMVFANLTQMTSIEHIKRQTQDLVEACDGSSGYASGDSPYESNR